jgi:hypothetical protein
MNETEMMDFVGRGVEDVGALLGGAMVVIGDKLGLYRAMAGSGPVTPAQLAGHTGTAERYVREWLSAQAARGYLTYEGDGRFSLHDEHAIPLTDETSPACVIGAFEIAVGSVYATDIIAERFRTGEGYAWGAHDDHVLCGCERFFRPGYLNNLASSWIPALDDVEAKLHAGARVARPIRPRRSSASTPTRDRLSPPANEPPTPASPVRSASKWHRPTASTAPTTWSVSSTACTTWATRPAPAPMSGTTSHRAGR